MNIFEKSGIFTWEGAINDSYGSRHYTYATRKSRRMAHGRLVMRGSLRHRLNYIYWKKEAELVRLSNDEYAKKLAEIKKKGVKVDVKTDRAEWIRHRIAYRQDEVDGKWLQLYTRENGRYYRYSTSEFDFEKVINPGRDAYNAVLNEIKNKYGSKRTIMRQLFGAAPEFLKICIPKQFYHINERFTGHKIFDVSAVDFHAHYPAQLCGLLPDANTMKRYDGTVKPSPEFPFAFYVCSGHSAIYGEFDTHEWLNCNFAFRLFEHKSEYDWDLGVEPNQDITILMKASSANLADILQGFYLKRKTDPTAKLVMNAFIGYLHKKGSYQNHPYAHIAAVCLARANHEMLKVTDMIGFNDIIQIAVDGMIYSGSRQLGDQSGAMGSLGQEFTGAVAWIEGTNKYIITDKNGSVIKFKMQGCNLIGEDPVPENYVPKFEDIKLWNRKVELK